MMRADFLMGPTAAVQVNVRYCYGLEQLRLDNLESRHHCRQRAIWLEVTEAGLNASQICTAKSHLHFLLAVISTGIVVT